MTNNEKNLLEYIDKEIERCCIILSNINKGDFYEVTAKKLAKYSEKKDEILNKYL